MIQGEQRQQANQEFTKMVGLFEGEVVAINPTAEEYKDILGIELSEDSKATNYLSKDENGATKVRVDIWLREPKSKNNFKVTMFLADKEKFNKDGTKKQYINNIGATTYSDDVNNLPSWFTARDYRVARDGEDTLYSFLRVWFGKLDFSKESSVLEADWKKLMKGNFSELKNQIGGEYCTNVVALATVVTRDKDGEVKQYQSVYNKAFLPAYAIKHFRVVKYDNNEVRRSILNKQNKDCKMHERFVKTVIGEYGCKDYYILSDLKEYNPSEDVVASSSTAISDDGPDY
jgi:hypothetical protein